jgi:hypothetical protein
MGERKTFSECATALMDSERPTLLLSFEEIHRRGAERYTRQWIEANRAAVSVLVGEGFPPTDPRMMRLVSLVVLKVLDAANS